MNGRGPHRRGGGRRGRRRGRGMPPHGNEFGSGVFQDSRGPQHQGMETMGGADGSMGADGAMGYAQEMALPPPPGMQGQQERQQQQDRQPQQGQYEVPAPVPMATPGLLEIMLDGFGFLRFAANNYLPDEDDIYVPANLVRRFRIRPSAMIIGDVHPPRRIGQKPSLASIRLINGKDPDLHAQEEPFKTLLACDPDDRFVLETDEPNNISMRVVDLLAPIGRGQRALIVAPPRSGKTILLQQMANAIHKNYPDVELLVLLVDERPEEVTDFRRNTKAEVIASCLDEGTSNHVKVTELVLEKMRRSVEAGAHMVVLLDSITRLGRAYNNEVKGSGRILSGGLDAKVLLKPKAFFGAARNVEGGGSLTIVATALVDTGSRMDQVIFEEFKGTGNSEIVLSRLLANNRIWPAIDISTSGTRKEEKLLHPQECDRINMLRRVLNQLNPNEAMRLLVEKLEKSKSNAEFLMQFNASAGL